MSLWNYWPLTLSQYLIKLARQYIWPGVSKSSLKFLLRQCGINFAKDSYVEVTILTKIWKLFLKGSFAINQFPQRRIYISLSKSHICLSEHPLPHIDTLEGLPRKRKQLQCVWCSLPIICLLLCSCLAKKGDSKYGD